VSSTTDSAVGTVAFTTLDCAYKLRIHYVLPTAITESFLSHFPEHSATVHRFSSFVRGAKDHFTLVREGRVHISGVFGDTKLVVTYSKAKVKSCAAEMESLAATLQRSGFGKVQFRVRSVNTALRPGERGR
jgi:hypothetical protein